jgi:hypothetical protein
VDLHDARTGIALQVCRRVANDRVAVLLFSSACLDCKIFARKMQQG